MKEVEIFTDGACSGNPGPGGWAAIIKYEQEEKKISGFENNTTNNRMELLALINALSCLKYACKVRIFSDSKYVVDSINKGWAMNWKKNKWMRSSGKKALNSDLWSTLLDLISFHNVELKWIKGHSGHKENEECDRMATSEINM
ncbi:MAG: ribonuclease HI [Firmicutes bacterium]|nr:ribonuclease HI [Bacillota bacterium]